MPDRAHLVARVTLHDRLTIGYGAIAAVMGAAMALRGLLLIYGHATGANVIAVQMAVFNLWTLPLSVSEALLVAVGVLCFIEGFRYFHDYRVSLAIRVVTMIIFWSYVVPATWNSFVNPGTTQFIIGALSTHVPLGLPYTVLAWMTRQEYVGR